MLVAVIAAVNKDLLYNVKVRMLQFKSQKCIWISLFQFDK